MADEEVLSDNVIKRTLDDWADKLSEFFHLKSDPLLKGIKPHDLITPLVSNSDEHLGNAADASRGDHRRDAEQKLGL
jgi:hypothetical protein